MSGTPVIRIRDLLAGRVETFYDGLAPVGVAVDDGDLLIGMDGDFNVVTWRGGRASMNQRVCCLRAKQEGSQRFLNYLVSVLCKRINDETSSTTVKHLSSLDLMRSPVLLPPERDQLAIADFLDSETARLDKLIQKKRDLIRLLDDRFAVLAEDFTSGRTSNEVHRSGIAWMPTINANWALPSIGHIFEVGTGTTPQSDDEGMYDGGIPWVNTGDLRDGPLASTVRTVSSLALERYKTLRTYPPGSLIVAMYGATIGKLGVLEMQACVNQACCVLWHRTNPLLTRWTFYWMLAHRPGIISLASGGGQPNISQEAIRRLRVPLPPDATIASRLAELENEHEAKARLVFTIEQQTRLLLERRLAVIAAAVTGRLPMPEVA